MKKTNLLALIVFVVALGYVFLLLKPTAVRNIQNKVMMVLSPFIKAGAVTETEVKHAVETPVDINSLRRDNEVLQQKVERLSIFAQKYEQLLEENNKFRAMLNYRKETPFKLTAARVLRRSASNWWTTVILDKGSMDGIGTDCPVITDVGLVGKTGKVALHTAEVLLLTDEECRVAARVEGTQAKGILTGERGGLEVRRSIRMGWMAACSRRVSTWAR
jgi:rod shape-determining protein MreC